MQRGATRAAFTRWQMQDLLQAQNKYNDALSNSEATEEATEKVLETDDVYKKNFIDANIIWNKILSTSNNAHASSNAPNQTQIHIQQVAPSISQKALPKLEIPKFNGSVPK